MTVINEFGVWTCSYLLFLLNVFYCDGLFYAASPFNLSQISPQGNHKCDLDVEENGC